MMEYVKAEAETISLDGIGIITASGTWPGHGWGDENRDHGGPPGQTGNKPGNGNGGSGAPGQGNKHCYSRWISLYIYTNRNLIE